ncbi:thiamine phosphate synthase [Sphingomonas sp. CGMCC 1.13654]|uniref:Thiamine-phosphate synthase n=1 Tax=Sphingomonas chungangi TaxID=2683589 RepID=A0A838L942_9SPHN|nr:thiamine phosphate synthase [Sphingomonas chungangi]MBA2935811.1 thiamine phosphate synthase [Sphingomonas chungangi]MVW54502.1 thiamine phosphate synthase [Sphingomonas chungangi]
MEIEDSELKLDPRFADRFDSEDRRPACQLYLISPPTITPAFVDTLAATLDGGPVAAFQLRLLGIDDHAIAKLAEPIQKLCADRDVAFLVSESIGLAKRLGADGVHFEHGLDDVREARQVLGPAAQIGVSAADSRHLAMEAGEAGADYISFGAFYPSITKDSDARPDPSILSWWTTLFELPCVAVGGITPDNAVPLVKAGADFLAVCGAIWNAEGGPATAVAAFDRAMRG